MMRNKVSGLIGLLWLLSFCAQASGSTIVGGVDGGGGVGVRCTQPDGKVTLELLDLHEARLIGQGTRHSPTSMEAATELASRIMSTHFWNRWTIPVEESIVLTKENYARPFFLGQPMMSNGDKMADIVYVESLPLSPDIGENQIGKGCALEQIAYWNEPSNQIEMVLSRWNELSLVDQAALFSHEFLYFYYRHRAIEEFGRSDQQVSSVRVRKMIGKLFSEAGLTPHSAGVPADYVDCRGENTYIFAFSDEPETFSFVFTLLHGFGSLNQMKVKLRGQLQDLMTFDGHIYDRQPLELVGQDDAPEIRVMVRKDSDFRPTIQAVKITNGYQQPLSEPVALYCRPTKNLVEGEIQQ